MAITSGTLKSSSITAAATSAGVGQAPDQRRLYDFGDRVAELSPEESPFFVYLNKVAKAPTNDPVFRFLENRSRIDWTSRTFLLSANVNGGSAVSAGSSYQFTVDTPNDGSGSVDYLVKGMVFAVQTLDSTAGVSYASVRIDSAPADQGSETVFTGRVIALPNSSFGSGYNIMSDNDKCQVVGTSFEEGTGSPDVWSDSLDDDFGYTQIFKTAAELTNTAIATNYRGYANEWQRVWNQKLREHKVDIERAMLFGQRARISGIQYSEGIVGHITANAAPKADNSALSYSSGSPYSRTVASAEFTYDLFLSDMEVLMDPARGGESQKLALAGLPVITLFNKMGSGGFLDGSLQLSTDAAGYRLGISHEKVSGSFGHSIMKVDTVHGSIGVVKEPLFRGLANSFMCLVDMSKVSYRPLVGNGLNRDTHIISNVQQADEDLRKDMILTEAGLEITLPESHMLYNFEAIS